MAKERFFTLEEANRLLPWLSNLLKEVASIQKQLDISGETLSELDKKSKRNGGSSTDPDRTRIEEEIRSLGERATHLLNQVQARGIIVRDPHRGLIDFPAVREGQEVYLCWLLGEPRIAFWHAMDTGFAGRQPL